MRPKDADGTAANINSDQTVTFRAVLLGLQFVSQFLEFFLVYPVGL